MNQTIDVKPEFQARARVRSMEEYRQMYARCVP